MYADNLETKIGSFSCAVIFMVILYISIVANAAEQDMVGYPDVWGTLSKTRNGNSECPDLKGTFLIEGDGYGELRGTPSDASMNGTLRYTINMLLRFDKKPNEIMPIIKNVIAIEQSSDNQLKISIPSKSNANNIENYYFNISNRDFECRMGWLTFQEISSSSAGEDSHTNFRDFIRLSRLADGSLVVFDDEYAKHTSIWYLGIGEYENTSRSYGRFKSATP